MSCVAGSGCVRASITLAHQETENPFPPSDMWSIHNTREQRLYLDLPHTGAAGWRGRRVLHKSGGEEEWVLWLRNCLYCCGRLLIPVYFFGFGYQPVPLSDREVISRLRNCLLVLAVHKVMLYDTSVLYCYESSLTHQVLFSEINMTIRTRIWIRYTE